MSATVGGAFKAALEAKGLGLAFYRGEAPPGTTLPYGIVTELPAIAEPSGDFGDPDGEPAEVRQQVQIDVWQAYRHPDGTRAEDYALEARVWSALRGLALPAIGTGRAYPVVPRSWVHVAPEEPLSGENLVRGIMTAEVVRTL